MMNGITFLCLFNISHFCSTNCSEVMSKRTQKDSGEERVTAKSKPMMNLVSRCSERNPDVLASAASKSLGKTRYESQLLLSSWTEQHLRTGTLVNEQPPGLFEEHTDRFIVDDDDMHSNTVAESDMSLKSRSFLWEERSRPGCQGPQRKYAGYLSTTLRKLKVSGSRNSRVIREMMRKEMK